MDDLTGLLGSLPHPGTCATCDKPATVYPLAVGTGTAWLCMTCKLTTVLSPTTRPIHDDDTED